MSIAEARAAKFSFHPPVVEQYDDTKPVLTIFLDCFYRLPLVKQSVQSVLDQDYSNVELMLIDNGAEPEVAAYLEQVYRGVPNVSLMKFAENQFSWDDTDKAVAVCWNAALLNARGEFLAHLAYDDLLSPNYASRMVALFLENPKCVTAAPISLSIDEYGQLNRSFNRSMQENNSRRRFTPGAEVAFDLIAGNPKKLFSAPGEVLVIRKSALLEHGGYDRLNDLSQILKYAILGDTGFDPEAVLYWRHHAGQLNRMAKKRGMLWFTSTGRAWDASGIVEMWKERFGAGKVDALLAFKRSRLSELPGNILREHVRLLNVRGAITAFGNIATECPEYLASATWSATKELALIAPRSSYYFGVRFLQRVLPPPVVEKIRARVRARRTA